MLRVAERILSMYIRIGGLDTAAFFINSTAHLYVTAHSTRAVSCLSRNYSLPSRLQLEHPSLFESVLLTPWSFQDADCLLFAVNFVLYCLPVTLIILAARVRVLGR